jgi:hypothetical protein
MRPPAPEAGADRQNDQARKGLIGHPRQQLFDSDGLPLSPRPRKGVPGALSLAQSGWPRSASDGSAA